MAAAERVVEISDCWGTVSGKTSSAAGRLKTRRPFLAAGARRGRLRVFERRRGRAFLRAGRGGSFVGPFRAWPAGRT